MASVRLRQNGRLFFDFRYRGERCREQTTLEDTPTNRRKMEAVLKRIESDIALNSFDYARYFPGSAMLSKLAEADRAAKAEADAATAVVVAPCPDTPLFADFVATWKAGKVVEWRHSYRMSVDSMLDCHLLPAFGSKPVGAIDRQTLLAFRAKLTEKRISATKDSAGRPPTASTVNRIMGILRQILDEAALQHNLVNPALKIRRLKGKRIDIQPFSIDEVRLILDRVRPDYRDYLAVRFFTGLRSAEAHGLKWKHIDFERRELLIRETYTHGRTEYTKTDGSQREVQMSQPVVDALMRLRPKQPDPERYVFGTRRNSPIDNKNFNDRVWNPLLRHLGLTPRRPYQMRHTCATFWLGAGENPQWIARQLGHTTTEMLFRTYARYVPNLTRTDGSAFDRLITSAVNGGVAQQGIRAPVDLAGAIPIAAVKSPTKTRGRPRAATEVDHGH